MSITICLSVCCLKFSVTSFYNMLIPKALAPLIGQHMDEANRKHSTTSTVSFNFPFHPILVIRLLIQHNQYFAFFELQFIVVVGDTVIKGSASPISTYKWVYLIDKKWNLITFIMIFQFTYETAIIDVIVVVICNPQLVVDSAFD